MKISYRNHPILEKLHKGDLGFIPFYLPDVPTDHKNVLEFKKDWSCFNLYFKQSIDIVTKPFANAEIKARQKLSNLITDIISNDSGDLNVSGTFIIKEMVYMIHFIKSKGIDDAQYALYGFSKFGTPVFYYLNSTVLRPYPHGWTSDKVTFILDEVDALTIADKTDIFLKAALYQILSIAMFKKYAEVETKYLPPNKTTKDINCKYVNVTKLGINILDSKWFTNLVKSDSFTVHGHFRLQPHGKEMKERKLIWISEFMKTGYTAPARKLQHEAYSLPLVNQIK